MAVCASVNQLSFSEAFYVISINETKFNETAAIEFDKHRQQIAVLKLTCTCYICRTQPPVTYTTVRNPQIRHHVTQDGELFIDESLDYEHGELYNITILCSVKLEQAIIRNTTVVEVRVLPINEFIPVFMGPKYVTVSVPEDAPIGSVIVSTLEGEAIQNYGPATDMDNGEDGIVRYLLDPCTGETDEILGLFQVMNKTVGDIILVGTLLKTTYTFRILACDGNRLQRDCPFITVTVVVSSNNTNFSEHYFVLNSTDSTKDLTTSTVQVVLSSVYSYQTKAVGFSPTTTTTLSSAIPLHQLQPPTMSIFPSVSLLYTTTDYSIRTCLSPSHTCNGTAHSIIVTRHSRSVSVESDDPTITTGHSTVMPIDTIGSEYSGFFQESHILLMSISSGILAAVLAVATVVCSILYCKKCCG